MMPSLNDHDGFKNLLKNANLVGVIVDTRLKILYCNDYLLRLTSWQEHEVVGKLWTTVFVPPHIEDLGPLRDDLFAGRSEGWQHDNDILTRSGSRRSIHWSNFLLHDAGGEVAGIAALGEDITDRKQLERALVQSSARARSRLEHDLHDGLGQELVGVALLARSLANRAEAQAAGFKDELIRLSTIASDAIESCRRIARGLSPLSDSQGGLVHAIRQLTVTPENWVGPCIEFQVAQSAPVCLTEEASDHVYRLAEEALSNAVRHSGAKLIKVMLSIGSKSMSLEILDDGVGISPALQLNPGVGLKLMRHRAQLLRAELRIERRAARGTQIKLLCAQGQAAA
jgi:PAS domain S-box-containing protein